MHLYLKRAWVLDTVLRLGRRARRRSGCDHRGMTDWDELLKDLQDRRDTARAMGGSERLEQQRRDGRLDARARIDRLLDDGTFVELGTLVGSVHRGVVPPVPADGLIAGHGLIDGRPVLVGAEDFTVMGGSIGRGTDREAPAPRRARRAGARPARHAARRCGRADAERVRAARPGAERPPDAGAPLGARADGCGGDGAVGRARRAHRAAHGLRGDGRGRVAVLGRAAAREGGDGRGRHQGSPRRDRRAHDRERRCPQRRSRRSRRARPRPPLSRLLPVQRVATRSGAGRRGRHCAARGRCAHRPDPGRPAPRL